MKLASFGVFWVEGKFHFLTLNNEKSALISLLDGCDEFVAIDDIDESSSSILRQISSSFAVAFALLAVGGNTKERENRKKDEKI